MKKIGKIELVHSLDTDPDLSWLGEYTDQLTDGIIVRKYDKFYEDLSIDEIDNIYDRSNELRGFKPGDDSNCTDGNYKKYALESYNRMEQINSGFIWFIGISAKAEILTSTDGKNWLINKVSSGGLWGIESDSDSSYIESVEKEELEGLKEVLKEYGFSKKEISKSFKDIQRAED